MNEVLLEFLGRIEAVVWGIPLLVLLVGTHLYLTFRLGFVQRFIPAGIKLTFSRSSNEAGDITHYGALATALAATLGTGNIVGVATAVASGGPGAIFWMWITGVFGIATKYCEALLAVKYRQQDARGEMIGGPMEVLEKGLGWKWLAVVFAVFASIAAFGIGNMVQSNSIADSLDEFGVARWVTGIVLAAAVGAVVFGGIKWIATACQFLVPIMVVLYLTGSCIILAMHASEIPGAIGLILESAFTGHAAVSGFTGAAVAAAIRYGIGRGLFSNESGMGSGGFYAAAARTRNPAQQALVSATGTFWDTVVICLITGLVIVVTGAWKSGESGADLSKLAFSTLPNIGPATLTVALFTFVLSTLLGWSYIGEKSIEYLFGTSVITPYRIAWVIAILIGSLVSLDVVFSFAGIMNGLMAIPNLITLLVLSGVAARESRKYLSDPETFRI